MPYNKSPITTVGNAIKVFSAVINIFLPKNLFKAIIIPNGMAIKEAMRTASNETFKEVITILRSESSKLKIRLKEETIASKKNPLSEDSITAS